MMKKGQASMALEKRDQIERKRCHRIMMPTLPAGTLDGRAPPAHRSARPRRTQLPQQLLQESSAFFFLLSLEGGDAPPGSQRQPPSRDRTPATRTTGGAQATTGHGARGADRDRDKPRVEPGVRCCVPCEPCLALPSPVLLP